MFPARHRVRHARAPASRCRRPSKLKLERRQRAPPTHHRARASDATVRLRRLCRRDASGPVRRDRAATVDAVHHRKARHPPRFASVGSAAAHRLGREHLGWPQCAAGQARRALRARQADAVAPADDGEPSDRRRPCRRIHAAPAATPREERRRHRVQDRLGVRAEGRPADRDRRTGGGRARRTSRTRCCSASPARARPSRWRNVIERDAAAGADPRAQQDARRAALRRVQELLPGQRGRVLRLLLRLLPARSLRAAHRHLHREGIVDQRADRPHAPRRHARAARARRRASSSPRCRASTASARSRPIRR